MEFNFTANPHVQFGPGKIEMLPRMVTFYGNTIGLITGGTSFRKTDHWQQLLKALKKESIIVYEASIKTEPSPVIVDELVRQWQHHHINVIVAIGGGSVIDAGKAVSAMMTKKESVIEYLEGIGNRSHDGKKVPLIALPTTSGTGSEATKNAVISQIGKTGFKKSLRHDNFIPDIAIVDPGLTLGCPSNITAACGMDALTQLIESYVSTKGFIMTDSLASGALQLMGDALINAATDDSCDIEARTKISYASYISGLTLANAGLGVVHGFASVIGGLFDIPHGVICGTLLSPVCQANIEILCKTDPEAIALKKYTEVASFLDPSDRNPGQVEGPYRLISLLEDWTSKLDISPLSAYGVTEKNIDYIVEATSQKNNPAKLSKKQLSTILQTRL